MGMLMAMTIQKQKEEVMKLAESAKEVPEVEEIPFCEPIENPVEEPVRERKETVKKPTTTRRRKTSK